MKRWIKNEFWFLAFVGLVVISVSMIFFLNLASSQSSGSVVTSEIFTLNTTIQMKKMKPLTKSLVTSVSSGKRYLAGQAQSGIFTLNTTNLVKNQVSISSTVPASIGSGP